MHDTDSISEFSSELIFQDPKQESANSANADMPCHEALAINELSHDKPDHPQNNHPHNDHCDGDCRCIHASFQQTPVLVGLNQLIASDTSGALITTLQTDLISISLLPPRRPPKSIS